MSDEPEGEETEQHAHDDSEVPPEQEDRIVDKVVAKVRDVFQEIVGAGGGSDDGGDASPTSHAPAGPAATEADMERQVREGVAKEITARERKTQRQAAAEAHEAEHEKMRSLVETPPKTYSKLTTAMWGGDDS